MSPMMSLFLLALALAADALAVALCQGAIHSPRPWRQALSVGAAFGAAQAIAPLIGWALGALFAGMIESVAHWIAFALLALAIATSIDAAAAGFTLSTIGIDIWLSVAVIGLVTFALSVAGVWMGRMGAIALGAKAEVVGGAVLIGLGVKVLFDHRVFG